MDPELLDELPIEARRAIDEADIDIITMRDDAERREQEIRVRAEEAVNEIRLRSEERVRERQRALYSILKPMQDDYARRGLLDEALAIRERARGLRASLAQALPDPGTLAQIGDHPIGTQMLFDVIGREDGIVWGTDVYTHDSTLACAAVHSSAIMPGERAIVRVTWVDTVNVDFVGTDRNGIWSQNFGPWPVGFRVERVGAPAHDQQPF